MVSDALDGPAGTPPVGTRRQPSSRHLLRETVLRANTTPVRDVEVAVLTVKSRVFPLFCAKGRLACRTSIRSLLAAPGRAQRMWAWPEAPNSNPAAGSANVLPDERQAGIESRRHAL